MSNLNRAEYHCYAKLLVLLDKQTRETLSHQKRVNGPALGGDTEKRCQSPVALRLFATGLAVDFSSACRLWNGTIRSLNLVGSSAKRRVKTTVRDVTLPSPEEASTRVDYLQIGLLSIHR